MSARFRSSALVPLLLASMVASSAAADVPWAIGHRVEGFVDDARGNRLVTTDVHYPADVAGDNAPVGGAPGESFPVVAFGHGYLLPVSAYAWVWEALVPQGFVVALPRTGGELFPNHALFAGDLAFVTSALQAAGASGSSPYFGRISARRALAGHSMGGGASLLGATSLSGLDVVASFAAAETNPSAIAAAASVTASALLFAGSSDCVTPPAAHQIPMYDALASSCRALVTIHGASHCQFAASNAACSLGEIGCPAPTIDRVTQQTIVRDWLLPWLEEFLKADTNAWGVVTQLLATDSRVDAASDCATVAAPPLPPRGVAFEVRLLGPNPFRDVVSLALESDGAFPTRLSIHDATGSRVRVLVDAVPPQGSHRLAWDGRDSAGRRASAGVYFYRAESAGRVRAGKIVRIP